METELEDGVAMNQPAYNPTDNTIRLRDAVVSITEHGGEGRQLWLEDFAPDLFRYLSRLVLPEVERRKLHGHNAIFSGCDVEYRVRSAPFLYRNRITGQLTPVTVNNKEELMALAACLLAAADDMGGGVCHG